MVCQRVVFHLGLLVVGTITSFLVQSAESSVNLADIFESFQYCTVYLVTYSKSPIISKPIRVPAYITENGHVKVNRVQRWFRPNFSTCSALLYLFPIGSKTANKKNRQPDSFWEDSRYRYRGEPVVMDSQQRFDILIKTENKDDIKGSKQWEMAYLRMLETEQISSHGLVVTVKSPENGWITVNHGLVINKFQSLAQLQMTGSVFHLTELLHGGGSRVLLDYSRELNDFRKNDNITWVIKSVNALGAYGNDTAGARVLRSCQEGRMTLKNVDYLLSPNSVEEEGLENYVFAHLLLGGVTMSVDEPLTDGKFPTIWFEVANSEYMTDTTPQEVAYLTCSLDAEVKPRPVTFLQVLFNFILIWELRIYYGVLATYVAPPIILGLAYHLLLKKRIGHPHWLKGDPFTWGIRALIWQAGDRRWNSRRFGFMTWLVIPWLLMAVVLSFSFRGSIFKALGQTGYQGGGRVDIGRLFYRRDPRVILFTDEYLLGKERNVMFVRNEMAGYFGYYSDIADMIRKDNRLMYIAMQGRVTGVMRAGAGEDLCEWGRTPKTGPISRWMFRIQDDKKGWLLENSMDERVLERMKVMQGEGQLLRVWRQLKNWRSELFSRKSQYSGWGLRVVVTPINMLSNIRYVFLVGLGGFVVTFGVWLLEWFWYLVYTRPCRKRRQRKQQRAQKIIAEQAVSKVSENVGKENEEELEVDAETLAASKRRGSGNGAVNVVNEVKQEVTHPENDKNRTSKCIDKEITSSLKENRHRGKSAEKHLKRGKDALQWDIDAELDALEKCFGGSTSK